ncbi:MAG: HAD hydrolase-like protein [Helicobacter sp.]|nr:HAD hydrolase-like protein [Helicobacter sp.]
MKFVAVVPIYTNTSMKKNFLLLNGKPLFLYIFETLMQTPMIDEVVCYSSNEAIKEFLPKGVLFVKRDQALDNDDVMSHDILKKMSIDIQTDYFILCSISSPFIKSSSIVKGIELILSGRYDSVFSVERHKKYMWFFNKPLNYLLDGIKKRTKEVESVYSETQGFYIFKRDLAFEFGKDIDTNNAMVQISKIEAVNVKDEEDLELAQIIAKNNENRRANPYFLLSKICKHVILDMDGVLIDSLALMRESWEQSGGSRYAPFDEYKKLIGLPFNEICLKLGIKIDKIHEIKNRYFSFNDKNVDKIKLYPGVKETLQKCGEKEIKISVVTSKNYHSAQEIIQHFGLEIDCLVAPDMPYYSGRNKPFADPLLYACIKNKVQPSQSIFVGDMLSDYQSAKEANIDFVFASYGYGELELEVNAIKDFADLKLLTI